MVTGSANQSAPAEQLTAMQKDRIAIIGVGCRFPGGVSSKDSLWKLLVEGREGIIEVPPDRWNVERYYDAEPGVAGKVDRASRRIYRRTSINSIRSSLVSRRGKRPT